ncbi:MAG: L-alanine-DL-glutamate epimerase-like enolase superfamily enzyme [Acidimicrobiales bacterium]|jgi:L-alanine-DL-glutamate epimerase-like enolase superfamily enzyme
MVAPIDDVSLTLFSWDDIPATTYGRHTGKFGGSSKIGLLRLHTADGFTGHAFLGSAIRSAELDSYAVMAVLAPVVLGADPTDRERLYRELVSKGRSASLRAIGAVDVALWDLAGQIAGLPIHRLLGSYRSSIGAYASSPVHDSTNAYVAEALHYRDTGWKAYKIHPPTEPDWDIEVCRAVRAAVGDSYPIMLDSTWAYSYPDALKVGRAVADLGFKWFEDPLADDDLYNSAKLRRQLDIPLLATEYSPGGFTAFAPWVIAEATDYLRGDVAVKGGISSLIKTAHLAEGFHMNLEIHHGGNSLNNVANLHVAMAIPNTTWFEVLLPDEAQKYGLVNDITVDTDGLVHAFDGPGLGAEIDFDLIENNTVDVISVA